MFDLNSVINNKINNTLKNLLNDKYKNLPEFSVNYESAFVEINELCINTTKFGRLHDCFVYSTNFNFTRIYYNKSFNGYEFCTTGENEDSKNSFHGLLVYYHDNKFLLDIIELRNSYFPNMNLFANSKSPLEPFSEIIPPRKVCKKKYNFSDFNLDADRINHGKFSTLEEELLYIIRENNGVDKICAHSFLSERVSLKEYTHLLNLFETTDFIYELNDKLHVLYL